MHSRVSRASSRFHRTDGAPRARHSVPTRRASDLGPRETVEGGVLGFAKRLRGTINHIQLIDSDGTLHDNHTSTHTPFGEDRKRRLNSSHQIISYAVFCLKKKKNKNRNKQDTPNLQ